MMREQHLNALRFAGNLATGLALPIGGGGLIVQALAQL